MKLKTKLIWALLLFVRASVAQAIDNFCPTYSREVNSVSFAKIEPIYRLSQNENRFFIGLYSKLTIQDRILIGNALKAREPSEMNTQLVEVQKKLAEKIKHDKKILHDWVLRLGLTKQIKILNFPENNYFLLFDASKEAVSEMICAAVAGRLPKSFLDIGY